jgi:hypothetical protein
MTEEEIKAAAKHYAFGNNVAAFDYANGANMAKAFYLKEIQAKDREIEKLNEIKKIVEYLMNHPHFNFEDQVYSVRDREGEGWDGPHVIGYGSAVAHLKELITPNDGKIEA